MTIRRVLSRTLLTATVTSLAMLVPASAQNTLSTGTTPTISQAPPNPRFVEYLNAVRQGRSLNLATPGGHALGLIPEPIDFSHLITQQGIASGTSIPASYDLRTYSKVTPVKDQGQCGDCWAFGTYGSLDSALRTSETRDFSENNLKNLSGFDRSPCSGGNSFMSMAYLGRWAGPVDESDDSYEATDVNTSPAGLAVQKHVSDVIVIAARGTPLNNNALKSAVMTYGAVQVNMYMDESSSYYNAATGSYYYPTSGTSIDHAVTLIGWDDNYSATNFSSPPPGNGAFLIKNSWGTSWGLSGYFWVSYYDAVMAMTGPSFVFSGNDSTTRNTRQYEHDPLGWVSSLGYGSTTAWFASVFTAVATERLQAVSFYAASDNSPYVISVYTGVTGGPTTGTLAETTSGTLASAGYHTVALPTSVTLTNGMVFSIVVELTTPSYNYPIPFEYADPGYSSQATASPGQSYFSPNGSSWQDATTFDSTANVCLKAFTQRMPVMVLRDTAGAIRAGSYLATTLANAGGLFASDPAAAQNVAGDTFVVVRDTHNSLWAGVFSATNEIWGAWTFGGGLTKGTPAVAVATNGTAYIAVRDTYNSYWLTSYTPSGGFGAWTYMGGIFSTDPAIAAAPDGSLYIVGKDTYNSLWSRQYIPASGLQAWHFGGGIVKGNPSVAAGTDSSAYVAVRDNWNSLWMARVQGATWLGWSYGGGIMSNDPQAAAAGDGTIYTTLLDTGNGVWYVGYTERSSSGWQTWTSTGGALQSVAPAAIGSGPFVAGRDASNKLWWYQGTGSHWTLIGNQGVATGALAATPR